MTGNDYDKVFGAVHSNRATFTERLGRAEPTPPQAKEPEPAGSGVYKPYGFMPSGNIGETCEVSRWMEGTETPEGIEFQYRFLMQVGFVGEEELKLFLPDCIVVIEGQHLSDLRKKLARRQVTFIQQYSPRVWPDVPPSGEPVIEKIQVVRPETLYGYGKNT